MKSKNRPPVSIVKIPMNKIDNYSKHFWGSSESIFVACDVVKLHRKGGKDNRSLFITTAAIYLFRNRFGSVDIALHKTVIDLTKVSYIEPDTLTLQFGEDQVTFRYEEACNIGYILLMQHACNYFQVPNASKLKVESSPPNALIYQSCPVRPINALQTRLLTISHFYRTPFSQHTSKIYKEWDQTHTGQFTIDESFQVKGAAVSVSHAIAWDSDIKTLVLHNFASDQISKVLSVFFEQSFSVQKIVLENYANQGDIAFSLQAREETSINALSFRECSSSIVVGIMRGLSEFNGRIKTVFFSSLTLSINEWTEIFNLICKNPCFLKLAQIRIDDLIVETFPVKQLVRALDKIRGLNHITFAKPRSDVTEILSYLLGSSKLLQHIEFFQCKLRKQILSKSVPPNMSFISISGSNVNPEFFSSFMNLVLKRTRVRPFVLDASQLNEGVITADLFNPLVEAEFNPLLCEFSWSGNPLSTKDFQPFLKFLVSQRKSLQYLDLSGCIKDDAGQILPPLFELIRQSSIVGIDISCDKTRNNSIHFIHFLQNLQTIDTIKSLSMSNIVVGEEGKNAILGLAKSNSNLSEIALDSLGLTSQDEFCSFYEQLCSIQTLKAIGSPRKEQIKLGITKDKLTPEVKAVLLLLKKKKVPQTASARIAQYERIEYENNDDKPSGTIAPRTKTNPLEELDSLLTNLVSTICGDDASEIPPHEIAKLIMDNIRTTSSSLSNDFHPSTKIGSIFKD